MFIHLFILELNRKTANEVLFFSVSYILSLKRELISNISRIFFAKYFSICVDLTLPKVI